MNVKHYRLYRQYALFSMLALTFLATALTFPEPNLWAIIAAVGSLLATLDIANMAVKDRRARQRFITNGAELTKNVSTRDDALKNAIAVTAASLSTNGIEQFTLMVMAGQDGGYHLHTQLLVTDPAEVVASE